MVGASAAVLVAQSTHIITSATLPAHCTVGDIYYKTGASAGFYSCSATDTWSTGSGSGTVTTTGSPASGNLSAFSGATSITSGDLSGDVSTSGSLVTTIGAAKVTNAMLAGSIDLSKLSATLSGSTTELGTVSGTLTSGHCAEFDASGNVVDAGAACGGGGGGGALSDITAATTTNTIASGNNSGQVWNWALTSDSVTAFTFGETTAATGGTSDNQVLVGINALASSTAVPLYIKNYGTKDSLRIDDVSGDTTPFIIDALGHVGINGASPNSNTSLYVGPNGSFLGVRIDSGSAQLGTYNGGWGTINNTDYNILQNTFTRLQFGTNGVARINRSGTAPTVIDGTSQFLQIGNGNSAANSYYLIGFGFSSGNSYSNPPAYIGFEDLSGSSYTHGDLIFGTRSTDTNVAATERMRILNDGTVKIYDLENTGSAGGKSVVCVDTTTGQLYASSTGTDCSN